MKDDTDKTLGAGASFLMQWDLSGGRAVHPRFDVNRFNVSTYEPSHSNYRESHKLSALGFGVDDLYGLDGPPKNRCFTAGAGVTRWDLSCTRSDRVGNSYSSTRDSNKNTTTLGLAAGLGWQFTRRWPRGPLHSRALQSLRP